MHATDSQDSVYDEAWSAALRGRLQEITRKRVPSEFVDDLVHDALAIIFAKAPADAGQAPSMRWCFQVLRNVIGNWYQKKRRETPLHDEHATPEPDPLAALTTAERVRQLRDAMSDLRSERAECADWLWRLARGSKPGAIAAGESLDGPAFYRRLYKCRKRLKEILLAKGIRA